MSKTINNLKEFLDWRGCGDDPYNWARAYYKYTACGPWVSFLLKGGADVYYEDIRKPDKPPVTNETCVGIKFGSIVEGSDVELEPYVHRFPFTTDEWQKDEEDMEKRTSFYWDRDNSAWYCVDVLVKGANRYCVRETWGEIVWEDEKPYPALRKKIEAFILEKGAEDNGIAHLDRKEGTFWKKADPDWKPTKIPGTRCEIWEFTNDTDY